MEIERQGAITAAGGRGATTAAAPEERPKMAHVDGCGFDDGPALQAPAPVLVKAPDIEASMRRALAADGAGFTCWVYLIEGASRTLMAAFMDVEAAGVFRDRYASLTGRAPADFEIVGV